MEIVTAPTADPVGTTAVTFESETTVSVQFFLLLRQLAGIIRIRQRTTFFEATRQRKIASSRCM